MSCSVKIEAFQLLGVVYAHIYRRWIARERTPLATTSDHLYHDIDHAQQLKSLHLNTQDVVRLELYGQSGHLPLECGQPSCNRSTAHIRCNSGKSMFRLHISIEEVASCLLQLSPWEQQVFTSSQCILM